MNGAAVRHAISTVTTTDNDVAGCNARAAQTSDIATHTSAARRAGLAGHGARNQRCAGELTYNSKAPAKAGATIKRVPMIQRNGVHGGEAILMRMIIIHASESFGRWPVGIGRFNHGSFVVETASIRRGKCRV